jgi:hypothetical protein
MSWTGTTAPLPNSVKLGYNRKEFAVTPVFGSDAPLFTYPGTTTVCPYTVMMPSFIATLQTEVQGGLPTSSGFGWLQYIATGKAATAMGNRDDVRQVYMKRLDPVVSAKCEYDTNDPVVPCLSKWLDNKDNAKILQDWWEGKGHDKEEDATLEISKKIYRKDRDEFVKKENICN